MSIDCLKQNCVLILCNMKYQKQDHRREKFYSNGNLSSNSVEALSEYLESKDDSQLINNYKKSHFVTHNFKHYSLSNLIKRIQNSIRQHCDLSITLL